MVGGPWNSGARGNLGTLGEAALLPLQNNAPVKRQECRFPDVDRHVAAVAGRPPYQREGPRLSRPARRYRTMMYVPPALELESARRPFFTVSVKLAE